LPVLLDHQGTHWKSQAWLVVEYILREKESKVNLAEKLHEEVYLYENVLEDPAKLVALIEELDSDESVHSVIPEWGFWFSNSADGHSFGSKKDFNVEGLETLESARKDDVSYVVTQIVDAVKNISYAYYADRGLEGTPNISPFAGVMKYRPGCEMGAHFDAQAGDQTLKYSIVMYLNDDYEGGEISFIIRKPDLRNPKNSNLRPVTNLNDPHNEGLIDFTLKPKAGSALIFPSTHPYNHQVHIIHSGDKYIFPGFIFIDEFDINNPEDRNKYNAGSSVAQETAKYLDEEDE